MTPADLLVLLDREQQTLSDENAHSAAALMREAAAMIRRLMQEAERHKPPGPPSRPQR